MANKKSGIRPKINLKRVIGLLVILLIVTGVAIQIAINYYFHENLKSLSTWQTKTLIADALEGLYKISDKVGNDGQIPEAKMKLDQTELENNDEIFYVYEEEEGKLQISSYSTLDYAINSSLNISNIETLFDSVPEAQACVRGFSLYIDKSIEEDGLTLVANKILSDGRSVNIYRENNCNAFNMDNLEAVIKTVESN